jgi:predicted MFS family arabinose efflux permease
MSSLHLYFIHPIQEDDQRAPIASQSESRATTPGMRARIGTLLRMDIWKTPFRNSLLVMLAFHLAQYFSIPLFPIHFVNVLHLTDDQIGIGTALFYLSVLLGSTQLARISRRLNQKQITGLGAMGMCLYPTLLGLSSSALEYYILSAIGGLTWAMIGGAFANYLLEKIPASDRPAHLAWYNIILNIAILAGSLAGPLLSDFIGLEQALLLFGFLRLISGIAILRWG